MIRQYIIFLALALTFGVSPSSAQTYGDKGGETLASQSRHKRENADDWWSPQGSRSHLKTVDLSRTGRVSAWGRKGELKNAAFALKSNLLFDAAITPNVEVERWFGRNNRFSLMAEAWFPWWSNSSETKVYELFNGGLEWRLWLHRNYGYEHRPLTGHFLGLYGSGGLFDLQYDDNGHRGEFMSAGLTYGYACRIASHFNLEFSLSAGYVGGPYRSYHPMAGTDYLIKTGDGHFNYIGPTKAKISLVWLIGGH